MRLGAAAWRGRMIPQGSGAFAHARRIGPMASLSCGFGGELPDATNFLPAVVIDRRQDLGR